MSVDGGFRVDIFHYSDMGSEVRLTMNTDVAGDLAMALDVTDSGWRDMSVELLEAVVDIDRPSECIHDWVNMQNEVIHSGLWCPKCNAVRDAFKSQEEAIEAMSPIRRRIIEKGFAK